MWLWRWFAVLDSCKFTSRIQPFSRSRLEEAFQSVLKEQSILLFDLIVGSRTGSVRRNRTGSAWELERMALVLANSLEGDARARGLLEYTIRITKPVREPNSFRFFLRIYFPVNRLKALWKRIDGRSRPGRPAP